MSSTPEPEKIARKRIPSAFDDATDEVKRIVLGILEIERERLYQDPPPNKEIRDEIVQLIKRTVS